MAKDHVSSVNDDKTYEALRDDGASKEKAARIKPTRCATTEPIAARGGGSAVPVTGSGAG